MAAVGSRTRIQLLPRSLSSLWASAAAANSSSTVATGMMEACSQRAVHLLKKLLLPLGMGSCSSALISKAVFWTCCCCSCCSVCARGSQKPSLAAFYGCPSSISRRRIFRFAPSAVPPTIATTTTTTTTTTFAPKSNSVPGFAFSTDSSRRFLSSASRSNGDALSVEVLARKLENSEYTNIVALVGAGASCSAGIPDFRTPGTGLYDKLGKYDLPMPESIFDLDYFTRVTPMPFVDLCQTIWPGQDDGPKPTPTHHFLKLLEDHNLLKRVYTQNIDGLESLAGISNDKLVECHGNFRSASCVSCKQSVPIDDCFQRMVGEGKPMMCKSCESSLVKPNIVFFGEELPSRFQTLVDRDTEGCDLLLVFGTSLLVMPVAGIPSWVPPNCPRVLFNLEPSGGIGRRRGDLFLQNDCDGSVQTVCELAGWKQDLEQPANELTN